MKEDDRITIDSWFKKLPWLLNIYPKDLVRKISTRPLDLKITERRPKETDDWKTSVSIHSADGQYIDSVGVICVPEKEVEKKIFGIIKWKKKIKSHKCFIKETVNEAIRRLHLENERGFYIIARFWTGKGMDVRFVISVVPDGYTYDEYYKKLIEETKIKASMKVSEALKNIREY